MIRQLFEKLFNRRSNASEESVVKDIANYEIVANINNFSASVLLGESRVVDNIIVNTSDSDLCEILTVDDADSFFKERGLKKNAYTGKYIPFHYIVFKDGYIVQTMPLNAPAILSDSPSTTISICYIGCHDCGGDITKEQYISLKNLIACIMKMLTIKEVNGFEEYNQEK